jgi:4-hydroxy-tetrahydrodipicolinate synthase
MSVQPEIQGIIVATLTPYDQEGRVDPGRVREHVEFLVRGGAAALAPVGTTGEFPYLTTDEKERLIQATAAAAGGRTPVIAGVWAPRLEEIARLCRAAEEAGAAAVFLTTPIYYHFPDEAIIAFYRFVRGATRLPVFCYNIPQYSNNEITLPALERMVDEGIVAGIKDSTGQAERLQALLDVVGWRNAVYAASDSFALAARRMGAHGFISALANIFPEAFARIWEGDEEAQRAIDRVRTAVKGYGGIAALKALLARRGFAFGPTRLPFTELDTAARREIDRVFEEAGLR